MYDADAHVEAQAQPEIRIGAKVHTGVLLSMEEINELAPATSNLRDADWPEQKKTLTRFFDLVFPPAPWWKLNRGHPVSYQVVRLPPRLMWEAFDFLSRFQVEAAKRDGLEEGTDKRPSLSVSSSVDSSKPTPGSTTLPEGGKPAMA